MKIILVFLLIVSGCTKKKEEVIPTPKPDLHSITNSPKFLEQSTSEDLLFKFYQILASENSNILISDSALNLATGKPPKDSKSDVTKNGINNSQTIWQKNIKPMIVEGWVAENTQHQIKSQWSNTIDAKATPLLTTTYSFDLTWEKPFRKDHTSLDYFKVSSSYTVQVPFMHIIDEFLYSEDENGRWLELPYKNEGLTLQIVLPKEGQSLSSIEEKLASDHLFPYKKFKTKVKLALKLPQTKINSVIFFKRKFSETGNSKLFNLASKKSSDHAELIQAATFRFDQNGTDTVEKDEPEKTSLNLISPTKFYCDQPFIFILKKNDQILFMGRLQNPTQD